MAIGRSLSTLSIEEFSGGCNYSMDLTTLAANESPNSMNMVFDEDSIYKRLGYARLTPSATGASDYGYSIFDMGVSGVGRKLVVHSGSAVYKMDNLDGVLDKIRSNAPASVSNMTEVNQNIVHTFSDYSSEYYWNGTDASMSQLSASAPGFVHVIEHQGYLLGASIATARLRIYYEDINTMIGGAYADFFTLRGGRDDSITGWLEINGRVYATTKTGVFRISFEGGLTVFSDQQVVSKTGMIPRTGQVVITEEFGEVAIFLGYDLNVYIFNGSVVRNIGKKFRFANNDSEIALDRIDQNYFENFHSVYDSIRQVYRLFVTRKGSDTNEYCMNISTKNFAYYPFDNMKFHSTTIAQDAIGRRFLVGADYAGRVHKMFVETNHDNGVAIKEVYESPPITKKSNTTRKSVSIGLLFEPVAKYKVTYSDRTDFDKTWKVRTMLDMYHNRDRFLGINTVLGETAILGSDVEDLYLSPNLPVTNNMYRFKLSTEAVKDEIVQDTEGTVSGLGGGTSVTGSGTSWTTAMTAALGWKIHIKDGVHLDEIYDFTATSATEATVSTMAGVVTTNDFANVAYEIYRSEYAPAGKAWVLKHIDYNAQELHIGKAETRG